MKRVLFVGPEFIIALAKQERPALTFLHEVSEFSFGRTPVIQVQDFESLYQELHEARTSDFLFFGKSESALKQLHELFSAPLPETLVDLTSLFY